MGQVLNVFGVCFIILYVFEVYNTLPLSYAFSYISIFISNECVKCTLYSNSVQKQLKLKVVRLLMASE